MIFDIRYPEERGTQEIKAVIDGHGNRYEWVTYADTQTGKLVYIRQRGDGNPVLTADEEALTQAVHVALPLTLVFYTGDELAEIGKARAVRKQP